ncbi:MAG: ArsA family ATPase, partial [Dermatophilaceae bacterium]
LQDPTTSFVVVATPERDAMREAAYFVERLTSERMPLAGVVVNRVQTLAAPALTGARAAAGAEQLVESAAPARERRGPGGRAADTADQESSPDLADSARQTAALLRLHADLAATAGRHEGYVRRFAAGHPGIPMSTVPAAATDIHDLDGLRTVAAALTD